jgi:hypothetical protein
MMKLCRSNLKQNKTLENVKKRNEDTAVLTIYKTTKNSTHFSPLSYFSNSLHKSYFLKNYSYHL